MLKSLLSTLTHITYKGVLSRGFCCVQVNSVLTSFLSTFTRTQNLIKAMQTKQLNMATFVVSRNMSWVIECL